MPAAKSSADVCLFYPGEEALIVSLNNIHCENAAETFSQPLLAGFPMSGFVPRRLDIRGFYMSEGWGLFRDSTLLHKQQKQVLFLFCLSVKVHIWCPEVAQTAVCSYI